MNNFSTSNMDEQLPNRRCLLDELFTSLNLLPDQKKQKVEGSWQPLKFSPQNKKAHFKRISDHIEQRKFQSDEYAKTVNKLQGRLMIWRIYYKFCCQLNLYNLNIGIYGVMNLSIINGVNYLTILKIGSNFIGNEGLRMIANRDMSILQELHLQNNYIGSRGMKYLLQGRWQNMSKLNLSHNPLGQGGIKYLSRFKGIGKLRSLGLQNCGVMGNKILPLFALSYKANENKVKENKIQQINLKNNEIDYWGFISMGFISKICPHLKSILISENHMLNELLAKQVLPAHFHII